jgi:folate-binding protein YgfZ
MEHERELNWLQSSVGVLDLGDRAVISVGGDDAYDWLQGQLTNQCEGAKPGDCVYAFILTLKGRVLADTWALFHEEGIWLDVPSPQVDAVMERLDRYIIMEDVDLERRDDLRIMAAQGPKADALVEEGWSADRLGVGGRQWLVPISEIHRALEQATHRAKELDGGSVSLDAWAHAHVVRGRPRFGVDFGDWTYPQESGLTPVAVSFTKGCYIGQETVVMLENRGKAPKVLWRWRIDATEPPPAKTSIRKNDEPVGEITSAVETGGSVAALGFLKRGHDEPGRGYEVAGAEAEALAPVAEHLRV